MGFPQGNEHVKLSEQRTREVAPKPNFWIRPCIESHLVAMDPLENFTFIFPMEIQWW